MCGAAPPARRIEAAHVVGRKHDERDDDTRLIVVNPLDVVPLCAPNGCHHAYDAGTIDLLPYLSRAEQVQAVSRVGLGGAYRRITGRRLP